MSWSPQQDAALASVSAWMKDPQGEQIHRLFGYAGTGKTTLAKYLAEMSDGAVKFAAYTGKAALVLQQKGCDATTLHRLIYVPKGKSDTQLQDLKLRLAELERQDGDPDLIAKINQAIYKEAKGQKSPNFELNPISELANSEVSLLIVDECSMVGHEMAQDILSFNKPVLVLGDPAQLPPVGGNGYFTDAKPDTMLTEIHRQAKDNPIVEMARRVRSGEGLPLGHYGECSVVTRSTKLDPEDYDQLLCGKNVTRHVLNRRIRQLQGYEGDLPMENEKLVCLRNNHEIGVLNGGLWIVDQSIDNTELDEVILDLTSDDDDSISLTEVNSWKDVFRHEEHTMGSWERMDANEFDFGYALTCHKSQGSQWENVMVMDESHVFKKHASRWLYTAITRASEKIDIVK